MNRKGLTFLLIVGIIVVGFMILDKVKTNDAMEDTSLFNEQIIDAAEVYMTRNINKYPEFNEVGDTIYFTVAQLIDYGVLNEDLKHPQGKSLKEVKVKLVIENDTTIKYEVID